jgi:hypothetical protein
MDNGKHLCRSEHLEGLRLQILSDAYDGNVSIASGNVDSFDFLEVGRQLGEDLGVRFDGHIDKPSDTAIVRLNLGIPLNMQPFSEEAKGFLARPGQLEIHQMWQNVFYGLSVSD